MKIVIDIPEEEYKMLVNSYQFLFNEHTFDNLRESIKNGTPLPKGHGRLVDVNSIPEEDKNITVKSILAPHSIACIGAITLDDYMNNLPTIIDADKENDNEVYN